MGFFAPAEAVAGPLRKGPYLQDISSDAATVRLELDPPGVAELELVSPGGDKKRVAAVGATGKPAAFHAFALSGLAPRSTYRYQVVLVASGKRDEIDAGALTTAPRDDDASPISFVVYGDNRSDDAAHESVAKAVAGMPGDFLVHTGDFVEDGNVDVEWQRFFEIERAVLKARPVFASIGNHDLLQPGAEAFVRYFGELKAAEAPPDRRRFSRTFRWGPARFLLLNAMDTFLSTRERAWVNDELARAAAEPGVAWRFVVLHHGPFSAGPHGPNARLYQSGVFDLLRESKIDLVISGHDHIYERGEGKGLKYVVSGGGGAPLYPVRKRHAALRKVESTHHATEIRLEGQTLSLVARRTDGSVLDKCAFAKGGTWDCDAAPSPAGSASKPVEPPPTAPPPSRCSCDVPGRTGRDPLRNAALGLPAALLALRRRRATPASPAP